MTIQKDKVYHLIACFSIAIIATSVTTWYVGFITAMLIGILKELFDQLTKRGTPDRYDLLADFVGSAVGTLLMYVVL